MSESRILVIDDDAVRAERTVSLLEFMDLNPRWVTDVADVQPGRHRQTEWMAILVGGLDDQEQADAFFGWVARSSLPPPVLLLNDDAQAFAQRHGLHEANVWQLEAPLRPRATGNPAAPRQPQAAGRRAPGRCRTGQRPDRYKRRRCPACAA